MRTTLDLPDPVFRRLKSRAAMEVTSLKALLARFVAAGLRHVGATTGGLVTDATDEVKSTVSAFDLMQDGFGMVRSGHRDLATNPKHMKDFGRD